MADPVFHDISEALAVSGADSGRGRGRGIMSRSIAEIQARELNEEPELVEVRSERRSVWQ
jgi:hypothetical protein